MSIKVANMTGKIKSRAEILKVVEKLRKQKKKIVFTNGCFDILHAGHLRVFKKAKSLGDVLIVGINSDKSIRELKGTQRPIVPDKYRSEIIASIEYVDFVTVFDEVSVAHLVKEIQPDVLVKGGHYKYNEVVGYQYAKKVVRIPVVEGYSTTGIINKIVKVYGSNA